MPQYKMISYDDVDLVSFSISGRVPSRPNALRVLWKQQRALKYCLFLKVVLAFLRYFWSFSLLWETCDDLRA